MGCLFKAFLCPIGGMTRKKRKKSGEKLQLKKAGSQESTYKHDNSQEHAKKPPSSPQSHATTSISASFEHHGVPIEIGGNEFADEISLISSVMVGPNYDVVHMSDRWLKGDTKGLLDSKRGSFEDLWQFSDRENHDGNCNDDFTRTSI